MSKLTLEELGWRNAFQQQLGDIDSDDVVPVRVFGVERSGWLVHGPDGESVIDPSIGDGSRVTAGDWLLADRPSGRALRRLERISLFKRRAPGTDRREQLIAANVDTLFIVSSCNQDFNEARIERYLALAHESEVMAVVVLTKADECDEPGEYVQRAASLSPGLLVKAVNARDRDSLACLDTWLVEGQTIALLGSTGRSSGPHVHFEVHRNGKIVNPLRFVRSR